MNSTSNYTIHAIKKNHSRLTKRSFCGILVRKPIQKTWAGRESTSPHGSPECLSAPAECPVSPSGSSKNDAHHKKYKQQLNWRVSERYMNINDCTCLTYASCVHMCPHVLSHLNVHPSHQGWPWRNSLSHGHPPRASTFSAGTAHNSVPRPLFSVGFLASFPDLFGRSSRAFKD